MNILPFGYIPEKQKPTLGLDESGNSVPFTQPQFSFAAPEMLRQLVSDIVAAAKLPGQAAQGKLTDAQMQQGAAKFGVDTTLAGLLNRLPANSFGAGGMSRGLSGPSGPYSPDVMKELAEGAHRGRNPAKLANAIVAGGEVPEAERDALKGAAIAVRGVVDKRAKTTLGTGYDRLQVGGDGGTWAMRDLKRKLEEQRVADKFTSAPMAQHWTADRRDKIAKWAKYDQESADKEARLATLEAITREARKRGWAVRHTSAGRDGRVTSRYINVPGMGEVRVSDHYIPSNAERDYKSIVGSGPRWSHEVIVDNWRGKTLDDFMNDISGNIED